MAYTGQRVEIPLGDDGLTGTKNFSEVKPTELLSAVNITYEDGTLEKEGGADKYNSTPISGNPTIRATTSPASITSRRITSARIFTTTSAPGRTISSATSGRSSDASAVSERI